MFSNPYEKFRGQRLTLNDYLAIDRTELANERTLLAYGRTAIALLITGVSAIKFFEAWWIWTVGALFIGGAIWISLTGWRRFLMMRRRVAAALERQTGEGTHPLEEQADHDKTEEKDTESDRDREAD